MLIKPSELSPATADAIAKLIPQYLDKECVKVGGRVELFYRYNNIKNLLVLQIRIVTVSV